MIKDFSELLFNIVGRLWRNRVMMDKVDYSIYANWCDLVDGFFVWSDDFNVEFDKPTLEMTLISLPTYLIKSVKVIDEISNEILFSTENLKD